jgi:transposase
MMRYPAGGGMNAAARVRREKVRIRAAAMFEESTPTAGIASELRVSEKSVREWRRRWTAGGTAALASAGPGGSDCELTSNQQEHLAEMLDRGPIVHGWDDARWIVARVAELIERPLRGLLHLALSVLSAAPDGLQPAGPDPPGHRTRPGGDSGLAPQAWPSVRG